MRKPRQGCVVTGLTQDRGRRRAAALYREAGVQKRAEGDFLLCTLPLPVLSRIVVAPEFSGPKLRAIRELNYDSSTKVLAVARRRFWEADDGIYGGGAFAWFMPGQQTGLYRHVVAPEGRIHIAGEHASLTHTGMQGALESGLRATREMLEAAQAS